MSNARGLPVRTGVVENIASSYAFDTDRYGCATVLSYRPVRYTEGQHRVTDRTHHWRNLRHRLEPRAILRGARSVCRRLRAFAGCAGPIRAGTPAGAGRAG